MLRSQTLGIPQLHIRSALLRTCVLTVENLRTLRAVRYDEGGFKCRGHRAPPGACPPHLLYMMFEEMPQLVADCENIWFGHDGPAGASRGTSVIRTWAPTHAPARSRGQDGQSGRAEGGA